MKQIRKAVGKTIKRLEIDDQDECGAQVSIMFMDGTTIAIEFFADPAVQISDYDADHEQVSVERLPKRRRSVREIS